MSPCPEDVNSQSGVGKPGTNQNGTEAGALAFRFIEDSSPSKWEEKVVPSSAGDGHSGFATQHHKHSLYKATSNFEPAYNEHNHLSNNAVGTKSHEKDVSTTSSLAGINHSHKAGRPSTSPLLQERLDDLTPSLLPAEQSLPFNSDNPERQRNNENDESVPIHTASLTTHQPLTVLPNKSSTEVCHTGKKLCGWIDRNGKHCGEIIGYDCAPHLAVAHGITKMSEKHTVWCHWCFPPEPKKRGSILRHVREVHLEIPRPSKEAE